MGQEEKLLKKVLSVRDFSEYDIENFEEVLTALRLKPEAITARLASLLERRVLKKHKISIMNLRILYIILALKETTQSRILKYLYTSAPNVSQRIEWLLKKGYIKQKKEKDPKDRRKKKYIITSKGRKKTIQAARDVQKFKMQWAKHFTPKESAQVFKYYYKLSKILDRMEKEER